MHDDITVSNRMEKISKKCPCCNESFETYNYIEQPLCNRCYSVAMKMLFSGLYDDLSAKEFKAAVKKEVDLQGIKEAGIFGGQNETGN